MLGCLVALSKSTNPFEYRGTGGMAYGSSRINTIHLSIFNAAPCIVRRPPCLGTPRIILILGILCGMKPWCDHLRSLNLCPLSPNIVVAVVNLLELVWFDVELVGFDICKVWYQNRSCLVFNKSEDICKWGILVKLVICVVPGHWKIKILNLKKRNKFFCFFMFLYPIQGGKNIGSPYLTNKSWFFGKSDVPGQQNKSYIGVMASKNLIFLMFWLSFVYL